MKKIKKILLLQIILLLVTYIKSVGAVEADSLRFSGSVTGTQDFKGISMAISYSESDGLDQNYINQTALVDNYGSFHFSTKNLGKPYTLSIVVRMNKKVICDLLYLTEPTDEIKINMALNSEDAVISFSGRGCEKYKLVKELQNRKIQPLIELNQVGTVGWSKIKDISELNLKMTSFAGILRRNNKEKKSIMAKFNISKDILMLINNEFADYDNLWYGVADEYYKAYPQYAGEIKRIYQLYDKEFNRNDFSISIIKYCTNYLRKLSMRIAFEMLLKSANGPVTAERYYQAVKQNYTDPVRDILFTKLLFENAPNYLLRDLNESAKDSLLHDALKIATSPIVIKILEDEILYTKRILRAKVIEGKFFDRDGNEVKLSVLRGKVILIDVWFNGCAGCSLLHKALEESIYPALRKDKRFLVLSVNVDKNRKRWLDGIDSKNYTSEDHLNVTTSNWFEDPFLKFYGATGAPWLMVIGIDGDIIYQSKNTTVEKLKMHIDSALSLN